MNGTNQKSWDSRFSKISCIAFVFAYHSDARKHSVKFCLARLHSGIMIKDSHKVVGSQTSLEPSGPKRQVRVPN
jgi:hypothetical protein